MPRRRSRSPPMGYRSATRRREGAGRPGPYGDTPKTADSDNDGERMAFIAPNNWHPLGKGVISEEEVSLDGNKTTVTVVPVSVASRNGISMLVPPFIEQHTNNETVALAKELLRVTREVRVLAGQFYLYVALTRSSSFTKAIAGSVGQDGANIVVGSLLRTMVISIAALFDQDKRTNNLPKLLNKARKPGLAAQLKRFHEHYDVSTEAEASRLRLIRYQRKLQSGWIRQAADRLIHVRQTHVAHFDAEPPPKTDAEKAIVRDLDRIVVGIGVIVAGANVLVLRRRVDFPGVRKMLRQQAGNFCNLLIVGAGGLSPG